MIFIKGIRLLWGSGGSFFIFMVFKDRNPKVETINHERIHFMQQLELLFVGMWVMYVLNLVFNLFKYRRLYEAYKNVVFEREAYANDTDLQYLINRRIFSWIKYFRRSHQ